MSEDTNAIPPPAKKLSREDILTIVLLHERMAHAKSLYDAQISLMAERHGLTQPFSWDQDGVVSEGK